MSEIRRYEPCTVDGTRHTPTEMCTSRYGRYVSYPDLLWYKRQYMMAMTIMIVVSLVCGTLAVVLVKEKASRGPAPVPTMAQRHADEQIRLAETHYQANKAEVDKMSRNINQASGVVGEALKFNDKLKAQIRKLNTLTDPAQQSETLRVAAAHMHDGQVAALAREMGFTQVRVVE